MYQGERCSPLEREFHRSLDKLAAEGLSLPPREKFVSPKESSLAYDDMQEEVSLQLVDLPLRSEAGFPVEADFRFKKSSLPQAIAVTGRLTVSF